MPEKFCSHTIWGYLVRSQIFVETLSTLPSSPGPQLLSAPQALLLEPEFVKAAETHKGTMTPSSTWLAGSPWFLHPSLPQFQRLP